MTNGDGDALTDPVKIAETCSELEMMARPLCVRCNTRPAERIVRLHSVVTPGGNIWLMCRHCGQKTLDTICVELANAAFCTSGPLVCHCCQQIVNSVYDVFSMEKL